MRSAAIARVCGLPAAAARGAGLLAAAVVAGMATAATAGMATAVVAGMAMAVVAGMATAAPAAAAPATEGHVRFRFPVQDPAAIWADMILHVDHDPADLGQGDIFCTASNCTHDFPNCYDQHKGTDFILDGGFETMDLHDTPIVAAAGGTVTEAVDGNYDRCHADVATQQVTCDGNPIRANYVRVLHADGNSTLYYHMKKGSVAVQAGDVVACGDVLGLIGSSGISSMPHVHFQVEDPDGAIVDPYAGPCGQAENWWVVEDAGNGLPGPWCEGDEIPAEPVPEPVEGAGDGGVGAEVVEAADAVEAPSADVPGELPGADVPVADAIPDAGPDEGRADGGRDAASADPGGAVDDGVQRDDGSAVFPRFCSGGCQSNPAGGAGGVPASASGAWMVVALVLAALVQVPIRRRNRS